MDNRVGSSFGFHGNRLEIYGVCGFSSVWCSWLISAFTASSTYNGGKLVDAKDVKLAYTPNNNIINNIRRKYFLILPHHLIA